MDIPYPHGWEFEQMLQKNPNRTYVENEFRIYTYIIIIHRLYFIYTFEGMEYIFYLFTPHIYML